MSKNILYRHGTDVVGKKPAKLMFLLGTDYIEWVEHYWKEDKQIAYYIWAKLFEQTTVCGESGIHKYMIDITIDRKNVMELYDKKALPTSATLAISLDEYDAMRELPIIWQPKGMMKKPYKFPDYDRLEPDE